MSKHKVVLKVFMGLVAFAGIFVCSASDVVAMDSGSIVSKAVLEGVFYCKSNYAYSRSWMASDIRGNNGFVQQNGGGESVKLPYEMTSASNNNLDCREVMFGERNANSTDVKGGLLPSNIRNSADVQAVAKYFAGEKLDATGGLGYKGTVVGAPTGGDTTGRQLILNIDSNTSKCGNNDVTPELYLNGNRVSEITFPVIVNDNGRIVVNQGVSYSAPKPNESYTYQTCGGVAIELKNISTASNVIYSIQASGVLPAFGSIHYIDTQISGDQAEYNSEGAWSFQAASMGGIINLRSETRSIRGPKDDYVSDITLNDQFVSTPIRFVSGINSNNRAGVSIRGLSYGGLTYDSLALTRQEVYDLYKHYADNIIGIEYTCNGDSDYAVYSSGRSINIKGGDKNCKIKNNGIVPNNLYGVDLKWHFNTKITSIDNIVEVLDSLGDLCNPKLNGVEGCNNDNGGYEGGEGGGTIEDTSEGCDKIVDDKVEGKIGAMQWILCPTLDNTKNTASFIDSKISEWLTVDARTYSNDSVRQVWENIRNVANVLMVVFLLAVVFSQLTGQGIDNYGIKKMLPRIITMAIIVNLSLYICQVAVDLSNITGVGLRDMLANFGAGTADSSFLGGMMMGVFAAASGATTGMAGATAAAILPMAPSIAVAVIILLIVVFVVIVVAVVIFFLTLAAREILLIFCILVSPIAFVLYILPNTQHIFKKWWNLFKAALVIFPICGATMGISYVLRTLAQEGGVSFGGPFGTVIMMVLPYLVFFLIPELINQALAGLGKIGGALTKMGQTARVGGRALGQAGLRGVQNTEEYKNWRDEVARNKVSATTQRTIDKFKDKEDLSPAEARRLARAQEMQRRLSGEDRAARTVLMDRATTDIALYDDDPTKDTLISRWRAAAKNGKTEEREALENVITSRYGAGGVNSIANELDSEDMKFFDKNGNFVNSDMQATFKSMQENLSQNTAFSNAMQNKASDAYQMISGGGYYTARNEAGEKVTMRGNLSAHAQHNGMATQVKDWATASNATLQRAGRYGGLDAVMAQKILSSDDQSVKSGILSDADKKATLQLIAAGKTSFTKEDIEAVKAGEDARYTRGGASGGAGGDSSGGFEDGAGI